MGFVRVSRVLIRGKLQMRNLKSLAQMTLTCAGLVLFCAPAVAGTVGLTLTGSGSSGDACTPDTPQSAAESFSYSDSGLSPLSDSGSATGYNNGSGCANSAVYGNSSTSGSAAFGALSASSSANMQQYLVGSGASDNSGWYDVLTAVSGGAYLVTITSINTVSASPGCPVVDGDGNPTATSQTGFSLNNQIGGIQGIADWATSDCTPTLGPTYVYGPGDVLNNQTVTFLDGVGAGNTFDLSAGVTASTSLEGDILGGAGPGYLPSTASSDTSVIVTVVGMNGATFTSASGADYNPADAPEPASWLLAGCGLALLGLRAWRRLPAAN